MWLKITMTENRITDMKKNIVIIIVNPSKERHYFNHRQYNSYGKGNKSHKAS